MASMSSKETEYVCSPSTTAYTWAIPSELLRSGVNVADGLCRLGPLWHELNRRGVTVIIHPTPPHGYKAIPDQPFCPCPIFDYPHETTRTVNTLN